MTVIEYMYNNNLSADETAYRFNLAGADRILKWVDIYNNEGMDGLNNHSRGKIPRSTYYYYLKQINKEDKYKEIKDEIKSIFFENK